MPMTTLRPEDLSFEAREHYEAQTWQTTMHPDANDFYPCKANATLMLEFMKEHRLKKTVANFERAFQHLKANGMLLVYVTSHSRCGHATVLMSGSDPLRIQWHVWIEYGPLKHGC